MAKVFVAVCGKKGAGKDTAAACLPPHWEVVKFAGALKEMMHALLSYRGVPADQRLAMLEEEELKRTPTPYLNGKSPREAMQTLGTEWGRELISPTLWVDCFKDSLDAAEYAVCTDLRFPNEVDFVKSQGGVIIKVVRPDQEDGDTHPSEVFIDQIQTNHVVVNDGSIEDLQRSFMAIVQNEVL